MEWQQNMCIDIRELITGYKQNSRYTSTIADAGAAGLFNIYTKQEKQPQHACLAPRGPVFYTTLKLGRWHVCVLVMSTFKLQPTTNGVPFLRVDLFELAILCQA